MPFGRNLLIHGLTVLALLAIVSAGARLARDPANTAPRVVEQAAACDLGTQSCEVLLEQGQSLSLTVTPRHAVSGRPMHLSLTARGIELDQAELEFEGLEMSMGVFRMALSPDSGGQFYGQTVLPVCVSGAMQWRLNLLVVSAGVRRTVPFLLVTTGAKV
jgi:hypothetical protein